MHGAELAVGDCVKTYTHLSIDPIEGVVVTLTNRRTDLREGFWIYVDYGNGPFEEPSWNLEKI
jgi:hypothetical protein